MQRTVAFLKWEPKRDFYTDNLVCWVKFSVIDSTLIGTPRERESVHRIKVVMTDMLLDTWRIPGAIDFGITDDMVKVALQSLEDYLAERLKSSPLAEGELSPLLMTTENSSKSCPYKLANIHYPNKACFTVEIEDQSVPLDTLSMYPNSKALERQHLTELRSLLAARFSEGELHTLCFDLGIDYENLPGGGKADKARELVAYCERHGRISDLTDTIQNSRPDILAGVKSQLVGSWGSSNEPIDIEFRPDGTLHRVKRDGSELPMNTTYSIRRDVVQWRFTWKDGAHTTCQAKLPISDRIVVEYENSWDHGRGTDELKKT